MKKILVIFLVSITSMVHADKFSKDLFAKNVGTKTGKLQSDNTPCELVVSSRSGGAYNVDLKIPSNKSNKYSAYANDEKSTKKSYDRGGNIFLKYDYLEAVNGGWVDQNLNYVDSWTMRVHFSKTSFTKFTIKDGDNDEIVCLLK